MADSGPVVTVIEYVLIAGTHEPETSDLCKRRLSIGVTVG